MTTCTNDALLTQSPARALRGLTIPGVLSHLTLMVFVLADMYFVGLLGPESLAAMSFTVPVGLFIFTAAVGLGFGVTSKVSHAWGNGDATRARGLATDGLLMMLAIVGLMCGLGLATVDPVFRAMGAGETSRVLISEYMTPWYFAMVVLALLIAANAILRGAGDTKTPLRVSALAAGLNIALDPCLMFGLGPFPELGLVGAVHATLISAVVGTSYALYALCLRDRLVSSEGWSGSRMFESWRELIAVAVPGIAIAAVPPLGLAIVTSLVARDAETSVAAYAVGSRIEVLVVAVPAGLCDALLAYVGQNAGAGRLDRVREGMRHAIVWAAVAGVAVCALLVPLAPTLAALFTAEPIVQAGVVSYLRIISVSYALLGIAMIASPMFLGLQRPGMAFVVATLRMIVLMVPAAIVGLLVAGLPGVLVGIAIANVVGGLFAWAISARALGWLPSGREMWALLKGRFASRPMATVARVRS
ncbi:MAG: MATE family efflux transporter [Myxococcota bacterium]